MAKSELEKINWSTGLIIKTFGLQNQGAHFSPLQSWLDVNLDDLSADDNNFLEIRRLQLSKFVRSWNEETLKMRFISFILDRANYDLGEYQGVFETELSAVVESYPLKVVVDFTVAHVIEDLIENPYFYFHEYKPKIKRAKDPLGQVLLAMLIAQELNKNGKPIYGCFVIGEEWYFMVLHGKSYGVANKLDALQFNDIQRILLVLRKFKEILKTELLV